MANYEINEEQEVLTKAMRMIETGDPVHADVYNALFSALLNNDVFLEKLANKMVQQAMVSHVMDSTNSNMVLGADQGPVITKLIDKVQEQVTVLNTKSQKNVTGNAILIQDTMYTIPSDGYVYIAGSGTSIDYILLSLFDSTGKIIFNITASVLESCAVPVRTGMKTKVVKREGTVYARYIPFA